MCGPQHPTDRNHVTRFLTACLLALCLAAPAAWAQPSAADAAFQAIHEKEWAWRQAEYGRGDAADADPSSATLSDVSAEAQARRLQMWESVLAELDTIDASALSEQNQVSLAVYRPQLEALAANIRLGAYEMPFNSDSSFWSSLGFMTRGQFNSARDHQAYAARLRDGDARGDVLGEEQLLERRFLGMKFVEQGVDALFEDA